MSGRLEVIYGKQEIPEYVRDILAAGASRLFLPAGFVEEGELLSGHFRTEGYRKLSSMGDIGTENIFSVILGILRGVWQTERIYLFSEMYEIFPDCIYVKQGYTDIRMVYVPSEIQKPPKSLTEKLEALTEYLRKHGSQESWPYMDKVIAFLGGDWGHRALVHRLEELRREVYLCSVK